MTIVPPRSSVPFSAPEQVNPAQQGMTGTVRPRSMAVTQRLSSELHRHGSLCRRTRSRADADVNVTPSDREATMSWTTCMLKPVI